MVQPRMHERADIGPFVSDFLGRRRPGACPRWPPDLFAVAAALLGRSGVYHRAVCWCAAGGALLDLPWRARVVAAGRAWRARLTRHAGPRLPPPPAEVVAAWDVLQAHADWSVRGDDWPEPLCRAAFALVAVADEACAGVGVDRGGADDHFLFRADARLAETHLRSLAAEVGVDRARVLPKQHTPQRGLTLRSYSHHLALCPSADVEAYWHARPGGGPTGRSTFQVLLLPWPVALSRDAFEALPDESVRACHPPGFGYFAYRAPDGAGFESWLRDMVGRARREVSTVDMLVFPELALGPAERGVAERVARELGAVLVAGLHAEGPGGMPLNQCVIDWTGRVAAAARPLAVVQTKHHRWCLDRGQVVQYGLGGRLDPRVDHWEYAGLDRRQINFVTVDEWLTTSVLLCEDLARQDPVTQTLRAVGPNLIIALLMDGPQLASRWPARYASVLAEDPGSSVLTLTSLGMARLSRPRPGEPDRGTVVARWRDVLRGEHELDLRGGEAAVLTLVRESLEEHSADGRGDGGASTFPTFGGFVVLAR